MRHKHVRLIVHGVVQGVFFRKHTRDQADRYGITGFVRNQSDGTVYIEAAGPGPALESFIRWCHEGPDGARVTGVDREEVPARPFSKFEIRY